MSKVIDLLNGRAAAGTQASLFLICTHTFFPKTLLNVQKEKSVQFRRGRGKKFNKGRGSDGMRRREKAEEAGRKESGGGGQRGRSPSSANGRLANSTPHPP